jgi:DNA-directed RNA polymerase specialized sigma24 family protein
VERLDCPVAVDTYRQLDRAVDRLLDEQRFKEAETLLEQTPGQSPEYFLKFCYASLASSASSTRLNLKRALEGLVSKQREMVLLLR